MVNLETSKNDDIDEDVLAKDIFHEIKSRMSEKIMKVNYGAMRRMILIRMDII